VSGGPQAPRTLRIIGPIGRGAPAHLDPATVARPTDAQLARLSTRQLFTYVGDPDPRSWRPVTPVPDIAAAIPSIYNAGVGASHRSAVVTLRRGIRWDTTPERELTAADVVRGLKRLADPLCPSAALPHLVATIRGMAEYCAGYAAAVAGRPPDPARSAAFRREHDVAGVLALDDETVLFELTRPTLDLVHILAMPCVSPAPVEYDAFVPGDPRLGAAVRSTGPYRPVPAAEGILRWEHNPSWSRTSNTR
jgi:peptide/nickel transport system substrate-binding protein